MRQLHLPNEYSLLEIVKMYLNPGSIQAISSSMANQEGLTSSGQAETSCSLDVWDESKYVMYTVHADYTQTQYLISITLNSHLVLIKTFRDTDTDSESGDLH